MLSGNLIEIRHFQGTETWTNQDSGAKVKNHAGVKPSGPEQKVKK